MIAAEERQWVFGETGLSGGRPFLEDLLLAFQRLDSLLERAVTAAHVAYVPEMVIDRFQRMFSRIPDIVAVSLDQQLS